MNLEHNEKDFNITNASYFSVLNEHQKEAVLTTEGPLLVLSGAGTGKTRVLTTRIAHILFTNKAWASQILGVTFTNKAAQEIKERVRKLINTNIDGLWLGTFHSIGARIIRNNLELLGLKPNFTILNTEDQLRLIKKIIIEINLDIKKFIPKVVLNTINFWKDRALLPNKININNYQEETIAKIYTFYQSRLKILNAIDFGDLILLCIELFTKNQEILAFYQKKFRYILVDEYQDTNIAQYLWLRLIAQKSSNICCVGDDDQSIYGWRGAEVSNILNFEKDFPEAKIIRLEQNYRSNKNILSAAANLIANNKSRLGKTLWTEMKGGNKITVKSTLDGKEEAQYISEKIKTMQSRKLNTAVLFRASFQAREFEEQFIKLNIPYIVIGGPKFYERKEIRDAIAYLRIIIQPYDGLAFERIVNMPKRGIGETSIKIILEFAQKENIPICKASYKLIDNKKLKPSVCNSLKTFLSKLEYWREQKSQKSTEDLIKLVLEDSGYMNSLKNENTIDSIGRIENLKELYSAIKTFNNIEGFIEHISLVLDGKDATKEDHQIIRLMTLHSAKGLEFDVIFLPGWEEGLFPHQRSIEDTERDGLEEERRLAYVGLTRAKSEVFITFTATRQIHGLWKATTPSRFINELSLDETNLDNSINNYHFSSSSKPISNFNTKFKTGERVFHQKFGYGRIKNVVNDKLEIYFKHTGLKKILADFIERA